MFRLYYYELLWLIEPKHVAVNNFVNVGVVCDRSDSHPSGDKKVKFALEQVIKAQRRSRGVTLLFL